MVKNSQKAKKTSVTSERVPISSKPSNLDCRDSGESFDAHIVAVCKIFEKGRGFCRAPCLAVGLLYTCILQGARQAQGPCCTNPSCGKPRRNSQKSLHEIRVDASNTYDQDTRKLTNYWFASWLECLLLNLNGGLPIGRGSFLASLATRIPKFASWRKYLIFFVVYLAVWGHELQALVRV